MDKVSIIIPVYNCEKYIEHTLKSVLNQAYKNFEVLVVDDASTDRSMEIIKQYAKKDTRIKIFNMPQNSGVSACRNLAISKASGRYIAFLDSDDIWPENKLANQLFFMKKHHIALSHTSYSFIDESGKPMKTGQVDVDFIVDKAKYMKTTQIGLSTVMIDRQMIPEIKFPNDRELCEDARTWMSFLRQNKKFYGLNQVLMFYRVRQHQLSQNKIKMAKNTLKRYLDEKDLPIYLRLYYFAHYAFHGFEKRLKKNRQNNIKSFSNSNIKEYE